MNAALTKPLHSQHAFACETAGAPMKRAAVRVIKLVLGVVLLAPPAGVVAFGVAAESLGAAFLAIPLAIFPVLVLREALTGRPGHLPGRVPNALEEREFFWRWYNPDNPVSPAAEHKARVERGLD